MSSQLPTERTAVVTGGASPRGIGRASADRLARDGWSVAILDIDEAAAKLTADEVADKYSVFTLGVGADVSDENSVHAAIAQLESALPPIIGLANIAGVSSPTEFLEVTPAEWDRVFNINMRGTFLVTQRVLPAMIAAGAGRIVSVSSISAQRGGGTFSKVPYSASKAAVIGFSRALAREVGQHNITGELCGTRADRHRHHGWHADRRAQGADECRHPPGPGRHRPGGRRPAVLPDE